MIPRRQMHTLCGRITMNIFLIKTEVNIAIKNLFSISCQSFNISIVVQNVYLILYYNTEVGIYIFIYAVYTNLTVVNPFNRVQVLQC